MQTNKNKWNGTKITVNYIGNLDNKFGVKKKKIILNDDKLELFFDYPIFNNKISSRQKIKNDIEYFNNKKKVKKEKEKTIFKSLNIKDWEKENNYNFYNYFNNFKYFHRVNNSKRILSSNNRLKLNKNKSSILIFENEIAKDDNKDNNENKENNYYSDKRRKKTDLNIVKKFNKTNRKKLSKKNIREIISNFNRQKISEIKEFNIKNRIINDKLKSNSLLLHLEIQNFKTINKDKTNNYIINKNNSNIISKNYSNKNFYLRDKNNNNNNLIINRIFKSYDPSNPQTKILVYQKRNNIINNINFISPKNINHSIRKIGIFCDASTNTDL